MKKIIAFAAAPALALGLAACGGNEVDEPAEAEFAEEEAVTEYPVTTAGTYTTETEDGGTFVTTLNEDGTFEESENGEVIRTGTWEYDQIRGTCFSVEGEDAPQCYNMGAVQDDGTVEVTGPDGSAYTMTKTD